MIFAGGPVIWIILALAVVAIVTYFGRLLDLRRVQIDYRDFLKGVFNVLDAGNDSEALAICEDASVPVGRIVATAIHHRQGSAAMLREAVDAQGRAEVSRLDRRLSVLAIIGQIAPLLGLLGSVMGFVKTVMSANAHELAFAADLLNGAMDALMSTALGLVVAIVVVAMYGSLRVRLDRIVVDLEAAASQAVGYLLAQDGKDSEK